MEHKIGRQTDRQAYKGTDGRPLEMLGGAKQRHQSQYKQQTEGVGEGVKRWEEKAIETREYGARKEKENTTRRQHENIINKEKSTR